MQINFANDLGYGSLKGIIDGRHIHLPSIVYRENHGSSFDPIDSDSGDVKSVVGDYFNHMDVSVNSSAIQDNGRYLVGDSANDVNSEPQSFNILTNGDKGKTDMALVITLSTIASEALERYYAKSHKLPSREIEANVNMVTALPIMEGSKHHARSNYEHRYTNCDHEVTISNFSDPVNVKIHFNIVVVVLEAQSAQYVIKYAHGKLMDSIMNSFKKHYPTLYKGMDADDKSKPSDIVRQPHVLGIDLGEGTTDFAVFENGQLNLPASSSINYGFGKVLVRAVRYIQQNDSMPINSREQLKYALNSHGLGAVQARAFLQSSIKRYVDGLTYQIMKNLSFTMQNSNGIDVVYVYGGGADPMEQYLRKPLQKALDSNNITVPIIFIDKFYAQDMNVMGLQMIMNTLAKVLKKNGGADK